MLFNMLTLRSLSIIAPMLTLVLGSTAPPVIHNVSQTVFNDLVMYTKYSSAAELLFSSACPKPLNSTLVSHVSQDALPRTAT